jgi:hypothetical protein
MLKTPGRLSGLARGLAVLTGAGPGITGAENFTINVLHH